MNLIQAKCIYIFSYDVRLNIFKYRVSNLSVRFIRKIITTVITTTTLYNEICITAYYNKQRYFVTAL